MKLKEKWKGLILHLLKSHGYKFNKNSTTLFGSLDIVNLYLKPVF